MSLLEAFLLEENAFDAWVAVRNDHLAGSGTAKDPWNGGANRHFPILISLQLTADPSGREAQATVVAGKNDLKEGDIVEISGVTGLQTEPWNGVFGIYNVSATKFHYVLGRTALNPQGNPTAVRITFPFDDIMAAVPPNIKIHLGPGVYQTRGFGTDASGAVDARGFQAKSGWQITGAGIDISVLQIVGADRPDFHYHAFGMPIFPVGTVALSPINGFGISDLTIDCSLDRQPGRPNPGYSAVVCGAVRILGNNSLIRRVKAINWGSKSFKEGCFVFSILGASGRPADASGLPIITESIHNGIEDCIAIHPCQSNSREITILHLGGLKNVTNQAQAFANAPFIRKNFVDGAFETNEISPKPYSSGFITSKGGTQISGVGTFVGKRPHFRTAADIGSYVRFYNPWNPSSRWNGYFPIAGIPALDTLQINLSSSQGSNDDSSLVVMGTEFRAIALTSANSAVVEDNHVHNCWIAGPYASLLDDSVSQPSIPPTLAREEHLDPLNALNVRSLSVRGNFFKNVAVGPYWNMGGVSGPVQGTFGYDSPTGLVTAFTEAPHKLWVGARVKIESAPDSRYEGIFEVTEIWDFPVSFASYFKYQLAPGLGTLAGGHANYRVVSGIDFLTIEDNIIEIANLDETEFAIKEYPLPASSAAQTYRAFGIVVADNGLSAPAGPYAHRQVFIRNNKIHYVNAITIPTVPGIGAPAGAAMQLSGIKQLHVTRNVIDVNVTPSQRTYRSGTVRFFHNNRPDGELRRGWKWDTNGYYDEPEAIAQDALVLSLLQKRKN